MSEYIRRAKINSKRLMPRIYGQPVFFGVRILDSDVEEMLKAILITV